MFAAVALLLLLAPLPWPGLTLAASAPPASATTRRILPAQDAWPVWSPTGGRIGFTRIFGNSMALEIVTLGANRQVVEVARSRSQLDPSWSSDGTTLAYAAGGHIYTVDGNGRARRRVAFPGVATAPAFRPGTRQIAYLTTAGARNTDLWVDGARWARDVIGRPAWNGDGSQQIAVQRDDGVFVVTGPGVERRVASFSNPGAPVFLGQDVSFAAEGRIWTVDASDNNHPALALSPRFDDVGTPSFAPDRDAVIYTRRGGLERTQLGGTSELLVPGAGLGAAWSPKPPSGGAASIAYAGPPAGCPGHLGLRLRRDSGSDTRVTGNCDVVGTTKADVIEGSLREGDVILAGAGNDRVHANDGHTDRVDCGPGRDEVWADRTDRLTACEIVHR